LVEQIELLRRQMNGTGKGREAPPLKLPATLAEADVVAGSIRQWQPLKS